MYLVSQPYSRLGQFPTPQLVKKAFGGDQGTFTEVKQRRPGLVLGWVNIREDRAL